MQLALSEDRSNYPCTGHSRTTRQPFQIEPSCFRSTALTCEVELVDDVNITKDIVLSLTKEKHITLSKYVNKTIILGIRPEHISENKQINSLKIEAKLNIVEPLGMETMVYFSINNSQVCGKVLPDHTIQNGKVINLYFNSLKFYFIDPETDLVLN